MTEEEFKEFEFEILPQSLFHVLSDDIDESTGARCEELILVRLLANNPETLKYKPLQHWLNDVCGKCYKSDIEKRNNKKSEL